MFTLDVKPLNCQEAVGVLATQELLRPMPVRSAAPIPEKKTEASQKSLVKERKR